MAIVKRKPTSPGRRFVVSIVDKDLHKGPLGQHLQVEAAR